MKMSKKTYNHAFTMSFSVSGSEHEDWYNALQEEPELVWKAIQNRLSHGMNDVLESCEGYDTYEEEAKDDYVFGEFNPSVSVRNYSGRGGHETWGTQR
jgi:hypothetical protein